MNAPARPDAYGVLTEPDTLTIQRLLPGPAERVWAYLTESDLRRRWLASGEMKMEVGAPFELVWRNNELTDPPGQRPADFGDEHRMQGKITEVDAPRRLSFTWGENSNVTFDLAEAGDKVMLTITHRRLPDRNVTLGVSAGWHMHLDILVARISDETPAEPFWDGWLRLKKEYAQRVPV